LIISILKILFNSRITLSIQKYISQSLGKTNIKKLFIMDLYFNIVSKIDLFTWYPINYILNTEHMPIDKN